MTACAWPGGLSSLNCFTFPFIALVLSLFVFCLVQEEDRWKCSGKFCVLFFSVLGFRCDGLDPFMIITDIKESDLSAGKYTWSTSREMPPESVSLTSVLLVNNSRSKYMYSIKAGVSRRHLSVSSQWHTSFQGHGQKRNYKPTQFHSNRSQTNRNIRETLSDIH